MARIAFAVPVLPGKQARDVPGLFEGRMAQYEESRANAGITMERVFEQPTPMGTFVIAYIEADRTFGEAVAAMGVSGLALDRDFLAKVGEVHGFDPAAAADAPEPETIAAWFDSDVTERGAGLAFCAPLAPGRTEAAREFAREAFQTRVDEFAASRRAMGVNAEVVVLNRTPMGDIICVYVEGVDPVEGNRKFAASQGEYDTWFKAQLATLFPPEIDFSQPVPAIAQIWDWHRSAVTA